MRNATKLLNALNVWQANILHYGSISLIVEPSRSTHMEAMAIAKEAGCLLSYDPNLRLPLWPSSEAAKKGIKSIWDHADIIKVWHQWSIESCLGTHTLVDILVCICQILFYFQALYNILFGIDGIYIIIRFIFYNY